MRQWICRSQYVPVSDGTRLAVYVFRAATAGVAPQPVVWAHDRYHQVSPGGQRTDFLEAVRTELADGDINDLGTEDVASDEVSLRGFPIAERLLAHGYTAVIVDSRGSGASFGVSQGPFGPAEHRDLYDITEWIAAQPWCDGKVGMFGRSYLGVSQYLAASTAPPHLVAIFPQMALFDLYAFAYDGGVFRDDFARTWGDEVRELDLNGPVAPLDDDPDGSLLAAARSEHRLNRSVLDMFAALPQRDSRLPGEQDRPYLTRSPAALLDAINKSGVAVYHLGGWYDVWARDAVSWTQRLTVPHRVVLGPWPHTGGLMGGHGYNLAEAHVLWFDHWLRGIDNGIMDGAPIRYYVIDAAAPWRSTPTWPPVQTMTATWHLRPDATISGEPAAGTPRSYVVDYGTTSGRTSRWASGYGAPFLRPDMTGNDARALCYTSAPLADDIEVVGAPVVLLPLDNGEVDVFVYLESVDAAGTSTYLTEGCLRVKTAGEVRIEMHPLGHRVPAGRRLRVAITGADADNARTPRRDPAATIVIRHDGQSLPRLELPEAFGRAKPDEAPLSTAQRAIWLAEQLGTAGSSYHLSGALELTGPVDWAALSAAVNEVVRRHAVLRTTIVEIDGEPHQRVHRPAPVSCIRLDLSDFSEHEAWPEHPQVVAYINRRWDLAEERPIRMAMATLPGDRLAVVLALHHIAADPVAVDVLFAELAALYPAYARGLPSPLPCMTHQYADVARWQQAELAGPGGSGKLRRYQEYLSGAPHVVEFHTDRSRPREPDHRGGSVRFEIDGGLATRVAGLAAAYRTSVFAVVAAAFAVTLGAWRAGDDLLIATPSLQRDEEWQRGLIGCLVNVLPVRVRTAGELTVAQLLHEVRSSVLTALQLRQVPFDALVSALQVRRDPVVPSLTQVLVQVVRAAPVEYDLDDVHLRRLVPAQWTAVKYDLALVVEQGDTGTRGDLTYRRCLFDPETADRIVASFLAVLEQLVDEPAARLADLRTMPRRTLRTVLDRWNPVVPPPELAGAVGTSEPVRCYVLDRYGRPAPVGVPGRLHVAGTGDIPDAYAGAAGGHMRDAGILARWTSDGRLEPVSITPVEPPDVAVTSLDEEVLAVVSEIWSDLLELAHVDAWDDFFDLGGDSMFAIRLISRIRRSFGIRLSLRDIFAAPTLAEQAALVADRRAA